jgi:hypothetical protein
MEMGNAHGALQHTGQLLLLAAKSGRPAATQQQYLEQFTQLMNKVAAQQVGGGLGICSMGQCSTGNSSV